MPTDDNDKKKYDIVKLPSTVSNVLNCSENVCIKVCKRPTGDANNPTPPLECSVMCLVKASEPQSWQWNPLRNYAISVKSTGMGLNSMNFVKGTKTKCSLLDTNK